MPFLWWSVFLFFPPIWSKTSKERENPFSVATLYAVSEVKSGDNRKLADAGHATQTSMQKDDSCLWYLYIRKDHCKVSPAQMPLNWMCVFSLSNLFLYLFSLLIARRWFFNRIVNHQGVQALKKCFPVEMCLWALIFQSFLASLLSSIQFASSFSVTGIQIHAIAAIRGPQWAWKSGITSCSFRRGLFGLFQSGGPIYCNAAPRQSAKSLRYWDSS